MSLYDQYFSDININYMYKLFTELIKKDYHIDISSNIELRNIYDNSLKEIFDTTNTDELPTLNNQLLNYNIQNFINNNKILSNNTNVNNTISSHSTIAEQNNVNIDVKDTNVNDTITSNENVRSDNNNFSNLSLNNDQLLLSNTSLKDNVSSDNNNLNFNNENSNLNKDTKILITKKKEEIDEIKQYNITSFYRSKFKSSRYNYIINLDGLNIKISELKWISKIIIPVEKNYLFIYPILRLIIVELNINITLILDNMIIKGKRKYGIYNVNEKINSKINENNEKTRITIDIRDMSNRKYLKNDILKLNIIEIKKDIIILTTSEINNNDYLINDFIKIINNKNDNKYIEEILEIIKINDNCIYCKNTNPKINKIGIYNNIDMKIINMNNLNIIYFNE